MRAVSLPLSAYPSGSYFTVNGSACSSHDDCNAGSFSSTYTLINTNPAVAGNCKKFNGGIECMGFAYYVYYQYNGINCSNANRLDKAFSITNTDDAQSYFAHLPVGSHIRVNDKHSIIIAGFSYSGISVYEGNSDSRCRVNYTTKTWSQLSTSYPQITYGFAQSHSHMMDPKTPWVKVPGLFTCLQRSGTCMYCNVTVSQSDNSHTIASGQCTKCGYYE